MDQQNRGRFDEVEGDTVLIIGAGVVGGLLLDLLSRSSTCRRVILATRNAEQGYRRAMLSELVAANLGHCSTIDTLQIDLCDVERTAEMLAMTRPSVIVNATCLQSWWVVTKTPQYLAAKFEEACVGPWIAMHLALTLKLMTAVRLSGCTVRVVNCSYPDAVNPVLARIGMSPTVGIGNVANPVPALRKAAADVLHLQIDHVLVKLIAHHYVSFRLPGKGDSGGAPYHLSVLESGRQISDAPVEEIFLKLPTKFRRVRGLPGQQMTAASAFNVVTALLSDTARFVHAPGPNGMIGGYPLMISKHEVALCLPDGLTIEQAKSINERGQQYDGIQTIDDSGVVTFTSRASEIMDELLGRCCEPLVPVDAMERAADLNARFRRLLDRAGVTYPISQA